MKRALAVVTVVLCAGCGESKGDGKSAEDPPAASGAPATAAVEMVATDLSPAGIAATIQAPKGAEVKEAFGAAEVESADGGFYVEIATDKADLAARKQEIEANDVNTLKRYVIDEADGILYESEVMGKTEFHLLVNVDGGESGFECQDSKGPSYTEAQARAMFDACKTLASK